MTLFKFDREFPWWGKNPNCKFCALALWMFKPGRPVEIPDEAAEAAERAGAGVRVPYEAMQQ